MFSGLGNWLERSDEDFLKDLYTDAGRRYKLENLRRARLLKWRRVLIGLAGVLLAGLACLIWVVIGTGALPASNAIQIDFFLLILLIAGAAELVRQLIDFQRIDGQIKTLLLVAQLKTD